MNIDDHDAEIEPSSVESHAGNSCASSFGDCTSQHSAPRCERDQPTNEDASEDVKSSHSQDHSKTMTTFNVDTTKVSDEYQKIDPMKAADKSFTLPEKIFIQMPSHEKVQDILKSKNSVQNNNKLEKNVRSHVVMENSGRKLLAPKTMGTDKDNDNISELPSTPKMIMRQYSLKPLLKKNSTFWPTAAELLAKHPSLELFQPHFDSTLRQSSPLIAIFNLLATVCGGGVLTLPIAFARAGLIPATIMMVFSAMLTDFAMYILCSCARRTGGQSYGDVARSAFGLEAEIGVTILLFIFLCFVIIAYMVLVKDIWTPVVLHLVPALGSWLKNEFDVDTETSQIPSDAFLVVFIIVSLPLLLKKNLHALRHTCYVGFISLIILVAAMANQAYQLNFVTDVGLFKRKAKWWADSMDDIIYAFPIISLSFFSIYNVLTVHSALINPTRERMKFVLDGTIILCLVLFYIVGLCGYLYAYDQTTDNILLNFPLSCQLVFIGRIGYGFTLMFGLPLVVLPCRQALLSIPSLVSTWWTVDYQRRGESRKNEDKESPRMNNHHIVNGIDFDEERPLLARNAKVPTRKKNYESTLKKVNTDKANTLKIESSSEEPAVSNITHTLSTLLLLIIGFIAAVAVPGVGLVWGICGSSMALIIGFFLPAAYYLKIRSRKGINPRSAGAWFMIIFSLVSSFVCTGYILNQS